MPPTSRADGARLSRRRRNRRLAFGATLSSQRLQYETGCAALQSRAVDLAPGVGDDMDVLRRLSNPTIPRRRPTPTSPSSTRSNRSPPGWREREVALVEPARTVVHEAPVAVADRLDERLNTRALPPPRP